MTNSLTLPQWLDDLIFKQMHAKHVRMNSDITVIDWDRSDILNYLGTYFPRSYTECYNIFKNNYSIITEESLAGKKTLRLFDFCCGTGGEIVGFLMFVDDFLKDVERVEIVALDGNNDELDILVKVIKVVESHCNFKIVLNPAHIIFDSLYDLDVLDEILDGKDVPNFDVIISFKAICEIVTKEVFEKKNPYASVPEVLLKKLNEKGILLLVDVTTYNNVSEEWLPRMMDKGLSSVSGKVIAKNEGWNESFIVSHSKKQNDRSKIMWRILKIK